MADLSKTIAPKSDQLNSDDLIAGPRTITVTRVVGNDSDDQPISIFYEGDNGKPYKPGLSMRRAMVMVWGEDGDKYPGRRMTLYRDPEIKFGGIKVGGIRISHMSHIDRPADLMLTTTRGKKGQHIIRPLAETAEGDLLIAGREAAGRGVDALRAWWESIGKPNRGLMKDHLAGLQREAVDADENARPLSQRLQQPASATESPQDGDVPEAEVLPPDDGEPGARDEQDERQPGDEG